MNNPCDDPVICHRAMELLDMGWPLRHAAQQLYKEYGPDDRSDGRLERVPSPNSVKAWAERGQEAWAEIMAADTMDAAKARARKVRRIARLMAELDMTRTNGLLTIAEQVAEHVKLEALEGRTLGTDAPRHVQIDTPAVHGGTAAAVQAGVVAGGADLLQPDP